MKRIAIKNFTDTQELDVSISKDYVCISQSSGSVFFHFAMTHEQAHQLADELVRLANKIEPDMPVESC